MACSILTRKHREGAQRERERKRRITNRICGSTKVNILGVNLYLTWFRFVSPSFLNQLLRFVYLNSRLKYILCFLFRIVIFIIINDNDNKENEIYVWNEPTGKLICVCVCIIESFALVLKQIQTQHAYKYRITTTIITQKITQTTNRQLKTENIFYINRIIFISTMIFSQLTHFSVCLFAFFFSLQNDTNES